jgi:hypothetical protein
VTAWSNNFNAIASGTTITTTNSGTSGTAFGVVTVPSGGSLTADAAAAFEGASGMQFVYPATSATGAVNWLSTGGTAGVRVSTSFWYRFSVAPSNTTAILIPGAVVLGLNSSGQFLVSNTSFTGITATSTAAPAGTWLYIQFAETYTSTTTGRAECIITTAAGAQLLSYDSGTTLATGNTTTLTYGRSTNVVTPMTASYDLLNASNVLTSGFPGSPAPAPSYATGQFFPFL